MERDLVLRAQAHDHEAFTELARLWVHRLYGSARLIIGDNGAAEDATQEALVAAWRDIATLRDPDRFSTWLRRLLVRACYREAHRRRLRLGHEVHVVGLVLGIPAATAQLADRDELERGFRRLTPEQRTILILRFFDDLPMQEVADTLGLPLGTAKSRLHRATLALRASLDSEARTSTSITRRTT